MIRLTSISGTQVVIDDDKKLVKRITMPGHSNIFTLGMPVDEWMVFTDRSEPLEEGKQIRFTLEDPALRFYVTGAIAKIEDNF